MAQQGWFSQSPVLGQSFLDVDFVNATTGWAVGLRGDIYQTTDGGNTWSTDNTSGFSYIVFISFINKNK